MFHFGKPFLLKSLISIFEKDKCRSLTSSEISELEQTLDDDLGIDYSASYKKSTLECNTQGSSYPDPFTMRKERRLTINDLMEYLHLLYIFYIKKPDGLHEFVKLHDSIVNARKSVEGRIPISSDDLKIALRICTIAYHKNICNYSLNENELIKALQWQYGGDKDKEVFKFAINNYEQYWDSVLEAYVRPSARIKRLHYLVEKLDRFSQIPCILQLSDQLPLICHLRQKYVAMLQD